MELSKEILESIDKQLTKDAAGRLADFIANANKIELENKKLKQEIENLNSNFKQATTEVKELINKINKYNNILEREDKLKEAEFELELNLKRWQVEKEVYNFKYELLISSKNDTRSTIDTLMRNPRAIEMLSTVENIPVWETFHGGGGMHTTKQKFVTGQKESIEQKD